MQEVWATQPELPAHVVNGIAFVVAAVVALVGWFLAEWVTTPDPPDDNIYY